MQETEFREQLKRAFSALAPLKEELERKRMSKNQITAERATKALLNLLRMEGELESGLCEHQEWYKKLSAWASSKRTWSTQVGLGLLKYTPRERDGLWYTINITKNNGELAAKPSFARENFIKIFA